MGSALARRKLESIMGNTYWASTGLMDDFGDTIVHQDMSSLNLMIGSLSAFWFWNA